MAVKKAPGKTIKHNPPAKKKTSSSRGGSAMVCSGSSRTSPKTNPVKKTVKKTTYKRNGAVTNVILSAIGGALVLAGVDITFSRLPAFSPLVKMGITGGASFLLYQWGRKIPLVGTYAPVIAGGLAMVTVYIGLTEYVVPWALNALGMGTAAPAPVVKEEQAIQNDATGQLGMRAHTEDGNYFDVYTPQAEQRANQLVAAGASAY